MADFNPVNYVGFQDPAAAIKLQQQQALAAQLMSDSQPRKDMNAVIGNGPYAQVAPVSPIENLSKALEKGLGGYMQYNANEKLADALGGPKMQSAGQSPDGQPGAPLLPWQDSSQGVRMGASGASADPMMPTMQERLLDGMSPGMGKAAYETRVAGIKKGLETQNTPFVTPQGTYEMGSKIMGGGSAPATQPNATRPAGTMSAPEQNAAITDLYGDKGANPSPISPQGNGGPVVIGDEKTQMPMAADGKPIISTDKFYKPDPTGKADFSFENTNVGVTDAKNKLENLEKENIAFSQAVSGFKNEGNQIANLNSVYQETQGGTLIAQNPELANKLVSLGIITDPSEISNLSNIQAAMNSTTLDTLRQLRDANTNTGGPTSRIMVGELNAMFEHGQSVKDQPEALHKILSQAQGLVDYNMDMAKGWDAIGGTGNRMASGRTMTLSDFANKFALTHNIQDYKNNAAKAMGPFKGMAGNNSSTPAVPQIGTIVKGHKFLGGDPASQQSWEKIP